MELLYRALRGSRLHGDETSSSDRDYFYVVSQDRLNFRAWKKKEKEGDKSFRGVGYFLHHLRRNSLQTMEIINAEQFVAAPDFQRLILNRREEFQDTNAFAVAYGQDMAHRRSMKDFKWLLHGIGYSNMVAKYFDRGRIEPRFGTFDYFWHECHFGRRAGEISLEDFDHVVNKTKQIIAGSSVVKKRNSATLEEAAKFFLTPEEYEIWLRYEEQVTGESTSESVGVKAH